MSKTPDNLSGESVDAICASLQYRVAQAETKHARALCESASGLYELAKTKERMSELICQHEPLGSIIAKVTDKDCLSPEYKAIRKACLKAAFFAVYGPGH